MRVIIKDINETPEQFQELHGKGLFLGGSEIATAAGLNKFSTPLQLWMRKTGRDTSVIDNKHTRLGIKMESVVAETFVEEVKVGPIRKNNSTFQDDVLDWATCTPDYFIEDFVTGQTSLLEIKTSGIWARNDWLDSRAPDYALIQLQWQMGICGVEKGYLAALIGGKDFYVKEVAYNKDVFAQLIELGHRFLEYVRTDVPPDASYNDDMSFIKPKEKTIELFGCLEMVKEFELLQCEISQREAHIKLLNQAKDTIKNKLIQQLGDANLGICGDYSVSRKIVQIKGSVRQPTEQIRFAVKKENKNNKEKEDV